VERLRRAIGIQNVGESSAAREGTSITIVVMIGNACAYGVTTSLPRRQAFGLSDHQHNKSCAGRSSSHGFRLEGEEAVENLPL
jgi:hypothetical protein